MDPDTASNGQGSDTSININPSMKVYVDTERGGQTSSALAPDFVILGHEMIHSMHANEGSVEYSMSIYKAGEQSYQSPTEELRTIGISGASDSGDITENKIRDENGDDRRTRH